MRKSFSVSVILCAALLAVVIISCGEFLPLDADTRVMRIEPSPVSPQWDQQIGQLLPSSIIYVENYSHVPVSFDEYRIEYFQSTVEGDLVKSVEERNLENVGLLTLWVPGVPTPDPYLPDSTATRQTKVTASTGLQILTAAAYTHASSGTQIDYTDDLNLSAKVTLWGESETGEKVILEGAVPISTLLQKSG
jgi:hypothetical protein